MNPLNCPTCGEAPSVVRQDYSVHVACDNCYDGAPDGDSLQGYSSGMEKENGSPVAYAVADWNLQVQEFETMSANWPLRDIEEFWADSFDADYEVDTDLPEEIKDFFESLQRAGWKPVEVEPEGSVKELGVLSIKRKCECDLQLIMAVGCKCGGE